MIDSADRTKKTSPTPRTEQSRLSPQSHSGETQAPPSKKWQSLQSSLAEATSEWLKLEQTVQPERVSPEEQERLLLMKLIQSQLSSF